MAITLARQGHARDAASVLIDALSLVDEVGSVALLTTLFDAAALTFATVDPASSAILGGAAAGASIRGVDAMKPFLERTFLALFPRRQHLISASMVTVTGDEATARTSCTSVLQHDEHGGGTMRTGGTYQDRLRRTATGWRISHRIVRTIWQEGIPPTGG